MWVIMFFLFISGAEANTYRVSEGAYRFHLEIKRESLKYTSKRREHVIKLNRCTAQMAQALNSYFFTSLVDKADQTAQVVFIDGVEKYLAKKFDPVIFFTQVDYRVMAINIRSREACH